MSEAPAPLAGIRVVEIAAGVSVVGAGLAANLPGGLMRDFGADVTHLQTVPACSLDSGVESERAWNRGKRIIETAIDDLPQVVQKLAADADILFLTGDESVLEGRGIGYESLARSHPSLIVARIRPSFDASGPLPDLELLVQARAGVLTQIRGHRPGPVFCDLPIGSAGAALAATAGALACLYEREATGVGGWVETSLYDGMMAMLSMIVGRVEHPSSSIEGKWIRSDPTPPLSFCCADGNYIQLWFGAKGAYEAFLDHIDDPPSEAGYSEDMRSGAINRRSERWAELFATRDRDHWMSHLGGHDFRCEPVLRPGEALLDPHVVELGLSVKHRDPAGGEITVLGPVAKVAPAGRCAPKPGGRLLSGVRVLDLSAYLAGPVSAMVLGELGADVLKVEPASGDPHRVVEFMFAAGQRGKRALGLDLKAPEAANVLRRLFEWSDVVHHNSRIGLSDRLGYDEATVRAVNPGVVYCHASGFGPSGPRALLPLNDHLMQALSGAEAAAGGSGRPPTYLDWGAIDIASGWVAACSIVAALYAQRRTGTTQTVSSTLLGAGIMLKSGAFATAQGTIVEGPVVDANQTGYGAAYRLYEGGDGSWLALAVSDTQAWTRLLSVVGAEALPEEPPALRSDDGLPQPSETILEKAFSTKPAAEWVSTLQAAGVPAVNVALDQRADFVSRLLDDPVNRVLGRVVSFEWGPRGRLEQPAFPARIGPEPRPGAPARIPALGEHTDEVLADLGLGPRERQDLSAAAVTGRG